MRLIIAIILSVVLYGCCWICPKCTWLGGCPTGCYWAWGYDYTHYKWTKTTVTPKGLQIDGSEVKVTDLDRIEHRVDKIEACLKPLLIKYKMLTEEQRVRCGCIPREYKESWIKRECIKIKLVEPVKGCFDRDLLPDKAPDSYCASKGLVPTEKCPCRWREVIQGDNIIVTTSTQMAMWDVVTVVTECSKVWESPFAACMIEGIAY